MVSATRWLAAMGGCKDIARLTLGHTPEIALALAQGNKREVCIALYAPGYIGDFHGSGAAVLILGDYCRSRILWK